MLVGLCASSLAGFQTDTIQTGSGPLKITFIGHGTLMFEFGTTVIHVDPWTKLADYAALPKAAIILVTHEHRDHLDPTAIATVRKKGTRIFVSSSCAGMVEGSTVLNNGDSVTVSAIHIEAVPAYNIAHTRDDGRPFHEKGAGNGYVLTVGDTRVYIGGDTENIPEMKMLGRIRIAFLPVNLPYTMTPAMAVAAVKLFNPAIVYPYHFGDTDTAAIAAAFTSVAGTELRIRKMK